MTTPAAPTRRFTLALTAAVASTTVAIGVTAATLLGWFRGADSATPAAAAPSVVHVPITPGAPAEQPAGAPAVTERVAMERRDHDEREHDHDDRDDREHDDE